VGAASPLDLPDSDFNMLRPEVNGYEVTWKYVCKPYWCEVLKGYRLVLSGGKPLGTGWEALHANHKVLHVNHEMKVMNLVSAFLQAAQRLVWPIGLVFCCVSWQRMSATQSATMYSVVTRCESPSCLLQDDEGAFQSYVASYERPRAPPSAPRPAAPPPAAPPPAAPPPAPAPPPPAPPPAAAIKPPDTKIMVATVNFKARHEDELG
jgi:hypothetical protein